MNDTLHFTTAQVRAFQQLMRQARRLRGKNQTQVANEVGVSQTLISKLERGPAPGIRMDELFRVLAYYQIDPRQVSEILGYSSESAQAGGEDMRFQSVVNALYALPDSVAETILTALEWMLRGSAD